MLALAKDGGGDKLKGLGPALAAEAMKNIGFDVAKPDRHVNRAVASFEWMTFRKWEPNKPREEFGAPIPTPTECLCAMTLVESIATQADQRVAFVDNAIWLLGADGGLHVTNREFARMACERGG